MSWLLSLAGGALLGIGFVIPWTWPLSFAGAGLLLNVFSGEEKRLAVFLKGWLAGCVLYGFAYAPVFWGALPLDWLLVFPFWSQVILIGLCWALSITGVALSVGLFALVFRALRSGTWLDVPLAGAAWMLCEWLGALWFSVESYGPGSLIAPHFSLGFVGNLLANDAALLQLAWLGGVYLLSAVVFSGGAFFLRIVQTPQSEQRRLIVVLGVCLAVWGTGHLIVRQIHDAGSSSLRVALIGMQEAPVLTPTPEERDAHFAAVASVLGRSGNADLVVLPENAEFLPLLREKEGPAVGSALRKLFSGETPVLLDSQTVYLEDGLGARLEYYDVASSTSAYSRKAFLLPDGEYIPYLFSWITSFFGLGDKLDFIASHRTFLPGAPALADVRGVSVGALFCDEALSPYLYRSLASAGAEVFVNTASHSWFHGSRIVASELLNAAKIRAVESRRWYAQASEAIPSYVLDPYGRIASESAWGSADVLYATVYARDGRTPYDILGDGVLCCALLVLGLIHLRRKRVS